MRKSMALPDSLHPKQWKNPRSWFTWKLGDFSLSNGQSPTNERPRFLSDGTLSWMSATMSVRSRTTAMVCGEIKGGGGAARADAAQQGRVRSSVANQGRPAAGDSAFQF